MDGQRRRRRGRRRRRPRRSPPPAATAIADAQRRGHRSRRAGARRRGASSGSDASTSWSTTPASSAGPASPRPTRRTWPGTSPCTWSGPFNTARAAWPHMVEQGYGRIVMTTSTGLFGLPNNLSYATAKGCGDRPRPAASPPPAPRTASRSTSSRPRPSPGWRAGPPSGSSGSGSEPPQMSPELVAPMVAFLAHEACPVSGEIYAAGAGRFARIFIASTEGYVQPRRSRRSRTSPSTGRRSTTRPATTSRADLDRTGRPPSWPTCPRRSRTGGLVGPWTSRSANRNGTSSTLCRDFAQREIASRAPLAWEEERCATDLLREMGELGLLGILVPEEWGGIGMSTVGFVAAMEQIGLADQSVAAAWQAHVTIGSLPLLPVRQRRSSGSGGCGRSPRAGRSAPSGSPSPTPAPTPAGSAPAPSGGTAAG